MVEESLTCSGGGMKAVHAATHSIPDFQYMPFDVSSQKCTNRNFWPLNFLSSFLGHMYKADQSFREQEL